MEGWDNAGDVCNGGDQPGGRVPKQLTLGDNLRRHPHHVARYVDEEGGKLVVARQVRHIVLQHR